MEGINQDFIKDHVGFHDFKKKSSVLDFHDKFSKYVASFGDVYFWEKGNFHVVTRANYARKALVDPALSCDRSKFFISRMPNMDLSLIEDFFSVVSKMMVMSDDQKHKDRRGIATFGLNDELIDYYAKSIPFYIEKFIEDALVNSNGEINFAQDIAAKLPSIILAEIFCVPDKDRSKFYEWSNIMTGFFGGGSSYENEDGLRVNKAAKELKNYFSKLLELRRDDEKNDFFSAMLAVSKKFDLDDAELISQAIMMLVAGQVTTTDQINNIMFQLLNSPEIFVKVKSDNELISPMIEELKRLDPAVTFIFRVARESTTIGKQVINKGDTVFISTHCINRDQDLYDDPHNISLTRKNNNHFSYGHGSHYCLGARLGRLEMMHLFKYFIKKYPHMKLGKTASVRDHYSLSFSGFKELYIKLGPRV